MHTRRTSKVPKVPMRTLRRYWLTFAFLFGFVVDNITLNRVDQLFDNIVLATYVMLAMASMLVLYAASAGKLPERVTPFLRTYTPLAVQFSFGGLLSGMLVFYSRSGSWLESWPFLLLILGVILGNEFIRDRTRRLVFNIAVLFVGLFSYVVLIVPVVLGVMGTLVFFASGVISLALMYGFLRVLYLIVPRFLELQWRTVLFTIGSIFLFLNTLYVANIIPPIPLSLTHVGIYHSVVRFDDGRYQLTYEAPPWWAPWRRSNSDFRFVEGDTVFCFASVFAPTRLLTDIYHRWEQYDKVAGRWVTHTRVAYPIAGGRDGGYRGYTLISNYEEGRWRCTVETPRGQVLGRDTFSILSEPRRELQKREE